MRYCQRVGLCMASVGLMSAEAVQWAWRVECRRLSDKLVLLCLAWKADSEGAVRVDPAVKRPGFCSASYMGVSSAVRC